jgi:hypothetical protein
LILTPPTIQKYVRPGASRQIFVVRLRSARCEQIVVRRDLAAHPGDCVPLAVAHFLALADRLHAARQQLLISIAFPICVFAGGVQRWALTAKQLCYCMKVA